MKFINKKTKQIINVISPTFIEKYSKNKDYELLKEIIPKKEETQNKG